MVKKKIEKIEILIFIISIVLQNFAIIKTDSFGIAFSSCVLIYFFIKYKMYKDIFNKKTLALTIFLIFIIINSFINKSWNINQTIRLYLIFFNIYTTSIYVKNLSNDYKGLFLKIFNISIILLLIYGIYDFIAQTNGYIQFLNIFSNNPSYGIRELNHGYSGWSNSARIYTCFFEPSIYSLFIVYSYLFIMTFYKKQKRFNKIILTILFLINLFFTFARTGYICFILCLGILLSYQFILKIKNEKIEKAYIILIVLIPMITFILMYLIGNRMFSDDSMKIRTNSSLYYLTESVDSTRHILLGHGIGNLKAYDNHIIFNNTPIENFAHNGYIEFIYQFGFIAFSTIISLMIILFNKIKSKSKWICYACCFTICISGAIYNVETINILLTVIYCFALTSEDDKND